MNESDRSRPRRDAVALRRYSRVATMLSGLIGFGMFAEPFITALVSPHTSQRPAFIVVLYGTMQGAFIFAVGLFLGGILRGLASVIELVADLGKRPTLD